MLRLASPRQTPARPDRPGALRRQGAADRTILVVDDLPEILDLWRGLARRLRGVRARVVTEVSGPRALDLVARTRFDLVLTDHRLGDVDGLRVLQQARATNPDGRRVLMTGYQEVPAPFDRVRAAAVDAYLAKPFGTVEAVRLVDGLLAGNALGLASARARARALEAEAAATGGHVHVAPFRAPTFVLPPPDAIEDRAGTPFAPARAEDDEWNPGAERPAG